MPIVLRFNGLSVVVYPADHNPAHVHVFGGGNEAVFNLNCPHGPVALRENYGFTRRAITGIRRKLDHVGQRSAGNGEGFMTKSDEFTSATRCAAERRAKEPIAVAARYDRRRDRIVVSLNTGLELAFPPRIAQGLEKALPSDLTNIELSPSGFGVHFPRLDAHLYLPALMQGVFGSKAWMAA